MNPKKKVKHRKDRAVAEGIKGLIDAGDRNLGDYSDLIQFLIADGDSNAAAFFGKHTRGLDHGDVECWMRPPVRQEFKMASACFERAGFSLYGRD